MEEKEEKKVKSPYTIAHKRKLPIWLFAFIPAIIVLLLLSFIFIVSSINKAPVVDAELTAESKGGV